jgi:hypothetical protein
MKNTALTAGIGLAILFLAVTPEAAHALQTHAAPEGLYTHQIDHVLFTLAMFGFAFRIRRSRLKEDKAWRMMAVGALLFALWNCWAIAGHFTTLLISPEDFIRDSQGLKSSLVLQQPLHGIYYILKMDHLICLPALFFFYLALRRMRGQPVNRTGIGDNR